MKKITYLHALEVLDSRWNPTVEVHLILDDTYHGKAIVPSGASTWTYEALELRDKDPKRYTWKWVLKAVSHINTTIRKTLIWTSYTSIHDLDKILLELDGTKNKSNLWANALLWVSMARCQAAAKQEWLPLFKFLWSWTKLPTPLINVLNGWAHALSGIDVQECMIVPIWWSSWQEKIRMWAEVFQTLKSLLKKEGYITTVWDEGWFAPSIKTIQEALDFLCLAIKEAGYTTDQIKIALDVAATELWKDWVYKFEREGVTRSWAEMVTWYENICHDYPLISIEDGFDENDFWSWISWTQSLWDRCMIVWDDLFVTNKEKLQTWIDEKQANSILIKLNQIWTVSETLETIQLAQKNWFKTIISHRSGETEDTFIADLAVATNAWWIKTWSTCRTDRTAKYNQLTRIGSYLSGETSLFL